MALPMGVITTVGFTAFTRICAGTDGGQQGGEPWACRLREGRHPSGAHLVWPKLQSHHFGQHVHGTLGGTYEEGQTTWSLGWLQARGGVGPGYSWVHSQ